MTTGADLLRPRAENGERARLERGRDFDNRLQRQSFPPAGNPEPDECSISSAPSRTSGRIVF